MRYRKRPVVIEAKQFVATSERINEILDWAANHGALIQFTEEAESSDQILVIPTLEGDHIANIGDWIIRGVANEFYPCKPDIFEATYEPAE